jgi:TetR/AcrR family transcriptional regulator, transcriptional repressor for nem operon
MDTRERILDSALTLVQTRGFNAFSFRDVANDVGIRTASIHHHFPSKDDLGLAMTRRYRENLMGALQGISSGTADAAARLERFVSLLAPTGAGSEKVCLCGILMSDSTTLSEGMRRELVSLVLAVESWLAEVLVEGRRQGTFRFTGDPSILARALFSGLQGVMMCVRTHKEPERFAQATKVLLALLVA